MPPQWPNVLQILSGSDPLVTVVQDLAGLRVFEGKLHDVAVAENPSLAGFHVSKNTMKVKRLLVLEVFRSSSISSGLSPFSPVSACLLSLGRFAVLVLGRRSTLPSLGSSCRGPNPRVVAQGRGGCATALRAEAATTVNVWTRGHVRCRASYIPYLRRTHGHPCPKAGLWL